MRQLARVSVRFIDLLASLFWVATLVMMVAATIHVANLDMTAPGVSAQPLLVIWALAVGNLAIAATILSAASWVVRQFEEAFNIAGNVSAINRELSSMRGRRLGVIHQAD